MSEPASSTKSLRIIFAGTPDFAATSLAALLSSEHQVIAVYTQPDRPAGRGKKLTASPVRQLANDAAIPVYQPQNLSAPEDQQQLAKLDADVMVVVAYGVLLPEAVLNTPRYGCLNVHASLLPRWRGAAPIHRALIAGDQQTGITIMQMDKGLDTGDMLYKKVCDIEPVDTAGILHARLSDLGATALLEALQQLVAGTLNPEPQDVSQACYASKLHKAEANIDWSRSAFELDLKIRGFNPWPVTYSYLLGERVRIWEAEMLDLATDQPPGTIITADKDGLKVATGQGQLLLTRMQLPGGKQLDTADLLNARQDLFRPGNRFGDEAST